MCCVSHLWIDTSMMYGVVHSFVYLFSSYTSRFSCMMMIRCYAMSFSMWRAYTLGVWLAQRYLNMLSLLSLLSSPLLFFCSILFFVFSLFVRAYFVCRICHLNSITSTHISAQQLFCLQRFIHQFRICMARTCDTHTRTQHSPSTFDITYFVN